MVKIKCHDEDFFAQRFSPQTWVAGYSERPWPSCSYCGSMHPAYLLEALRHGAKLGGSDWKYGWPHKFYVTIPNPKPERLFVVASCSFDPKDPSYTKINNKWVKRAPKSTLTGKWYNIHLMDEGVPEELFDVLHYESGIKFERSEAGLKYSAPCHGYQVDGR